MTTTPQTNATLEDIARVLRDNDNFVICGHVSPDGDCLGCQLALAHALRHLGKTATCVLVNDDPVEPALSFMPGMQDMIPAAEFAGACDVFVGVDVPTRERIGEGARAILDRSRTSITIDHHASPTAMCDYVYVDPDAAAASMLVWDVAKMLCDGAPPLESAECAYVGLATDTGGFRFQNCDKQAFDVAAELVDYGIDPGAIATSAFQSRTMASLKLEARTIDRMTLLADGRAALSWVCLADFQELGAFKSDAEPLIDTVRSLAGVRVACMLREQEGCVRGSLRSKDDTDVSVLARQLKGGGHKAAAGFTLNMTLAEAIDFMTSRLVELVGE